MSIQRVLRSLLALAASWGLTAAAAPANLPEAIWTTANPRVQEVIRVQESITPDLMALDGILGTAVSEEEDGQLSLVIYVDVENASRGEIMRALPRAIRGVRVTGELTERFVAMPGKPGGGGSTTSPRSKQTPPIQLGTSGGWGLDLANGYCCGGTLGSLVSIGGVHHILSNYHVLEADTVGGGNGIVAQTGDVVIQPGLIDVSCNAGNAQTVATLVRLSLLPGSNVDAAVAKVEPGMVRTDGAILGIGPLSSSTRAAALKLAVKKSGRTTGLTRSSIAGLNATVSVTYQNECAGGAAFTKTFTGQIMIANKGSRFLAAGDSGSLLVEDVSSRPRAVGLLFAGNSSYAVANSIDEVLTALGATMVGQ